MEAFGAAAIDYVLKPVEPQRLARTCERLGRQLDARRLAARGRPAPDAGGASPAHDASRPQGGSDLDAADGGGHLLLAQLRRLLAAPGLEAASGSGASAAPAPAPAPPLSLLPCSVGSAGEVRMVPLSEVVMLEAADKYVRVLTSEDEYLIRSSFKELLPRLDARQFWQVHRGTVVRADAVQRALREESGRLRLSLAGRPERPVVSRLHAHLFKPL